MSSKSISVIMSVYNEKKEWLKDAIDSILNQTYRDFEYIIIMDNPSNIELINFLNDYQKKDSRIKVYINEVNKGLVYSLNRALKLSNGDFIARMDADDYSYPTRFEKQVEYLNENKDISLCATGVVIMNEFGEELYRSNIYGTSSSKAEKSLLYRNVFPHGSWMFRREILDVINQYNDVNQAEDYDLLFRLISRMKKISVIDEYLFKYRLRENGISFNNLFKQKVTMLCISKAYLKSKKNNSIYNTPKNINNIEIDDDTVEKYNKYQMLYTKGIKKFRSKNVTSGLKDVVTSVVNCKYKRNELKAVFILKIIDKL